MASILDLKAAIREFVRDGDIVAMEGFTHLIPSAAELAMLRDLNERTARAHATGA